ncbi:hypothetical protein OG799_13125 [Micromonospora sp. NBC_00898]|uniref:inositol monophosphatase family protein n=1 Tax=Micromonospora sp. NBC_00898 TaxID=2975981 RepID=UPI00386E553F|nr:hypothetical protein OG799_13125 [Micromonospora sp. NBC_00898]
MLCSRYCSANFAASQPISRNPVSVSRILVPVAIGLPAYVVGIAFCERGSPVLGVVHDPVAGRTWPAVRGQGGFVHAAGPSGRPLRAPRRPVPSAPVLAWTQGHEVRRDDSTARALKVVLDSTARRVLQLWAPLLSWVMLARGDIDGIVGYRPEAVDLPAGMLLAAEAGTVVRALDGGCFRRPVRLPGRAAQLRRRPAGEYRPAGQAGHRGAVDRAAGPPPHPDQPHHRRLVNLCRTEEGSGSVPLSPAVNICG